MEKVNIDSPGYRMKKSPVQQNTNMGMAAKTGIAGLTSSPFKIAWIGPMLAAIKGLGIGTAIKTAAAGVGKKLLGKAAMAAGGQVLSNIANPRSRNTEGIESRSTSDFANMKFGTGGSAFTMKKKNSPINNYKKGYYGV